MQTLWRHKILSILVDFCSISCHFFIRFWELQTVETVDTEKLLATGKPRLFLSFNTLFKEDNKIVVENFVSYTLEGRTIVKAVVEFGRETSNTKSSSHAEYKIWLKMVPYRACFHFIALFCFKALTVNADRTCKKCC